MKEKILANLFFLLCFLAFIPFTLNAHPSDLATCLLNQFQIEVKRKSSSLKNKRIQWHYSATAKPLSLVHCPKIPLAFQHIDALHINVSAPISLADLFASKIQLHPGDQLTLHSASIHLKKARLNAQGQIKYLAHDDWVGNVSIDAHNVDIALDELFKSGAIREPHLAVLKLILSGISGHQGSRKNQPLKIIITFKDKMLWIQDLPVCPISMLFKNLVAQ